MWIEVHCGECGGCYTAQPVNGWVCKECGHVIVPSDLVDVDEWKIRDGVLVALDRSY